MSEAQSKNEIPEKTSESAENKSEERVSPFVCDLCDKVFEKKGPLSNHRNLVHTLRSKEMHCDFCDEFFFTKKDLCNHISSKHSEFFIKQAVEALGGEGEAKVKPLEIEEN